VIFAPARGSIWRGPPDFIFSLFWGKKSWQEGEADEEGGHLRAAQRWPPMEEVRREEDQQHQLPQVRSGPDFACFVSFLVCFTLFTEEERDSASARVLSSPAKNPPLLANLL
jgi:hypothetical protein